MLHEVSRGCASHADTLLFGFQLSAPPSSIISLSPWKWTVGLTNIM